MHTGFNMHANEALHNPVEFSPCTGLVKYKPLTGKWPHFFFFYFYKNISMLGNVSLT